MGYRRWRCDGRADDAEIYASGVCVASWLGREEMRSLQLHWDSSECTQAEAFAIHLTADSSPSVRASKAQAATFQMSSLYFTSPSSTHFVTHVLYPSAHCREVSTHIALFLAPTPTTADLHNSSTPPSFLRKPDHFTSSPELASFQRWSTPFKPLKRLWPIRTAHRRMKTRWTRVPTMRRRRTLRYGKLLHLPCA